MPWYVLTGTPGAGKTAILRQLEIHGYAVVEEAATDVIALQHALGRPDPWQDPTFVDQVVALQHDRQTAAHGRDDGITFFDRSPVCTLALCRYADVTPPVALTGELELLADGRAYDRTAFFVRNQGFVTPTAARRISYPDSLVFERLHEEAYREFGFDLVEVPAGPLADRVALIEKTVAS